MDAPVLITLLKELQGLSAFVPPEGRRDSAFSGASNQKIFLGGVCRKRRFQAVFRTASLPA
jgi:hypothetical protein